LFAARSGGKVYFMAKELIVSVNGREKKIAVVQDGQVVEFYIERGESDQGFVGNIYKGRVQRVLPGMQSAFVDVGLERDAFLYVSDFFDEEEEFERIMMEKAKKAPADAAEKEASEEIKKARFQREKQMEKVQELAEPIIASGAKVEEKGQDEEVIELDFEGVDAMASAEEETEAKGKRGRDKGGKKGKETKSQVKSREPDISTLFVDDSSDFERIVDDEETAGEMFKEAFVQEAILDKVRAVEFDMESVSSVEIGAVLANLDMDSGGFERIADEDDDADAPKPKRGAKSKAGKEKPAAKAKSADKKETKKSAKEPKEAKPKKTAKAKTAKAAKDTAGAAESAENEGGEEVILLDFEASVSEPSANAEFGVRRGGRRRRRGTLRNGKDTAGTEERFESAEMDETVTAESEIAGAEMVAVESEPAEDEKPARGGRRRESSREGSRESGRESGRESSREGGRESRDGRDGARDNRDSKDGNRRGGRRDRSTPTITDLLREGQEVIVQIAKEPIARKGARITSHIALPGRHLVYMPTIEHVGVSRKVENVNERSRLRKVIQKIRDEEDIPSGGFIVRTAGIGVTEESLREDARYLVRVWLDIKKQAEKSKAPKLVHQDLDLVQRILRDQLSEDFAAIRVDSEEEYMSIVEFINRVKPSMVNRVKLFTRDENILEAYGVQAEIDKALKPRVWLKSGGYLVINQTEALVAIDVNTGKFVGKGNARLEDTITKTNMEAVDEIARQIRLRDLGGIIVLDLIDMEDRRNRHKVLQALQEHLSYDKSPTKVLSFNDFGLIIMTRKRVKQSLERTLCSPCAQCQGSGLVKSPETVCYEILEEARRLAKHSDDVNLITLRAHTDVVNALYGEEREVRGEIEAYLSNLDITGDSSVHPEQFDFAFV
jgi:ribonuclease G